MALWTGLTIAAGVLACAAAPAWAGTAAEGLNGFDLAGASVPVQAGGLPMLAPAALAAYVAMLLGIASMLGLLRLAQVPMPVVVCLPEACDDRPAALPSSGVSS